MDLESGYHFASPTKYHKARIICLRLYLPNWPRSLRLLNRVLTLLVQFVHVQ